MAGKTYARAARRRLPPRGWLVALMGALVILSCQLTAPDPTAVPVRTRTPRPEATITPTARRPTRTPSQEVPAPTPTDVNGQGALVPTDTPASAPTSTSALTADPGQNLLVNGDFSDRFSGWQSVNGHWLIHDGSGCDDPENWPLWMSEMDRDRRTGWEVGWEDWLWQDVQAPPHSQVLLGITEAHHMHTGDAEVFLYGSEDGTDWTQIFYRPEPEAEFGVGHFCVPPPSFTYVVEASFPHYRVEFHGRMNEQEDGWLFGPVILNVK